MFLIDLFKSYILGKKNINLTEELEKGLNVESIDFRVEIAPLIYFKKNFDSKETYIIESNYEDLVEKIKLIEVTENKIINEFYISNTDKTKMLQNYMVLKKLLDEFEYTGLRKELTTKTKQTNRSCEE